MVRLLSVNRKTILIACCLVFFLSVVALALNLKHSNQILQGSNRRDTERILRQIEASPDQVLRVAGNETCPLRILEAKVKEVPGALFTALTGKVTELANVSSVPEVKLVNTSGKVIARFVLLMRNPEIRSTRGLIKSNIAIKPGESYIVKREDFGGTERVMVADKDGQAHQTLVKPSADSEKRWIQSSSRTDLFITVAKVDFEDGSTWIIKEGGEIK